jgi:hypothetical protein
MMARRDSAPNQAAKSEEHGDGSAEKFPFTQPVQL